MDPPMFSNVSAFKSHRKRVVLAGNRHDDRSIGGDILDVAVARRGDEDRRAVVTVELDAGDGGEPGTAATVVHAQRSSLAASPLSMPQLKYSSGGADHLFTENAPTRRCRGRDVAAPGVSR